MKLAEKILEDASLTEATSKKQIDVINKIEHFMEQAREELEYVKSGKNFPKARQNLVLDYLHGAVKLTKLLSKLHETK